MVSEPRDELDDGVATTIRRACADLHPSDALRAAVLLGLSPHEPAASPSRRWRVLAAAGGLAAAVVVGVLVAPRRAEKGEPPPSGGVTPRESAASPDEESAALQKEVEKERAADRAWYEKEWPALRESEKGKWILVWSGGQGYGSSPELEPLLALMAGTSPQPKHRYVFRAGEEGDVTTFASEWYGPRFAGSGLAKALGVRTMKVDTSIVVTKDGARVEGKAATPYPRIPVSIATLAGSAVPASGPPTEMWLGSVGPALMLAPEDEARLSLAQWEVPGTETVMDVPCRRVLVQVAIPGIPGDARVVAAVPTVPRERLAGLARARDQFWTWPENLRASLDLPAEGDARGQWIVFGNDRVLGRGPTAETALADADARMKDVVYHRYLMSYPDDPSKIVMSPSYSKPRTVFVGGRELRGFENPEEPGRLFVPDADEKFASDFGLDRAEAFRVGVMPGTPTLLEGRGGYVFATDRASGGERRLLLVVTVQASSPSEPDAVPSGGAAMLILRNLAGAEAQMQAAAKIDVDQDGEGEFAGFAELSGAVAGRMARPLSPPLLGSAYATLGDGDFVRGGFRFRVFLPGAGGVGVREPSKGYSKDSGVDADLAEKHWCCYAWPDDSAGRGYTYFMNERGVLLSTPADGYRGANGPRADAAFRDGPASAITGSIAEDAAGRDGHSWRVMIR